MSLYLLLLGVVAEVSLYFGWKQYKLKKETKKLLPGSVWKDNYGDIIIIKRYRRLSDGYVGPYPIIGRNLLDNNIYSYEIPGKEANRWMKLQEYIGNRETHPEYFL